MSLKGFMHKDVYFLLKKGNIFVECYYYTDKMCICLFLDAICFIIQLHKLLSSGLVPLVLRDLTRACETIGPQVQ